MVRCWDCQGAACGGGRCSQTIGSWKNPFQAFAPSRPVNVCTTCFGEYAQCPSCMRTCARSQDAWAQQRELAFGCGVCGGLVCAGCVVVPLAEDAHRREQTVLVRCSSGRAAGACVLLHALSLQGAPVAGHAGGGGGGGDDADTLCRGLQPVGACKACYALQTQACDGCLRRVSAVVAQEALEECADCRVRLCSLCAPLGHECSGGVSDEPTPRLVDI
jgi:hypothetical protein